MRLRQTASPFDNVNRIAVLRGGGLGDLLLVEPAIRALAEHYRGATVTLIGTQVHQALLADRGSAVTDVEILPRMPGVRTGPADDSAVIAAFVERMRRRHFDLAIQLHGGGRHTNPFILQLGATHSVGAATPDALKLERTLAYQNYEHETLRALEIAALAGAESGALEAAIGVLDAEYEAAAPFLPPGDAPLLVVHPGATDPRRRWPVERFAAVAASVATAGARVAVVGDASEAALAERLVALANAAAGTGPRGTVTSLAGRTSLGELIGVCANAQVVLANDSGVRHLAQAIGCQTVGIYWVGNLINSGPLLRSGNRVHISWTVRCPVCGVEVTDAAGRRCQHDVAFVSDVQTAAVAADIQELMATSRPLPGR